MGEDFRREVDIMKAKEILDADHYDLKKVKDRILDYLSVRRLKPNMKGPILCFVGPPGVGKTSLGKSIARALGRKFVRLSLGGVHDEAEIRGHRRTYIGALPGQIIQGIRRAETKDPVFMLDEIDKVGRDFRGDPSQRCWKRSIPSRTPAFRDNYLDVTFDLSKVLFITTANMLDPIAEPLRDRMEIIELQGYTEEEKVHIAFQYLIPRQIEENGITAGANRISGRGRSLRDPALHAGSRRAQPGAEHRHHLPQAGASIGRRQDGEAGGHQGNLQEFLGGIKIRSEGEIAERTKRAGVAVGLAWTPSGGDVLFVEANKMKGKGGFTMTGQIGQVMQESMQAALTWVRSNAARLGIGRFFRGARHSHSRAGGSDPERRPSAGVTMATALVSLLTDAGAAANRDDGRNHAERQCTAGRRHQGEGAGGQTRRSEGRHSPCRKSNQRGGRPHPEQLHGLNVHYVKLIDEVLSLLCLLLLVRKSRTPKSETKSSILWGKTFPNCNQDSHTWLSFSFLQATVAVGRSIQSSVPSQHVGACTQKS